MSDSTGWWLYGLWALSGSGLLIWLKSAENDVTIGDCIACMVVGVFLGPIGYAVMWWLLYSLSDRPPIVVFRKRK